MDLQPIRQFDYLQRALSIFMSNPSDMSEQFESLIDELIKENHQINKSPKINSPESSSSDSKSDLQMKCTSPQPLPVNFYSIAIISKLLFIEKTTCNIADQC